jgi:hypothetical protein
MKITIVLDNGSRRKAHQPYDNARHVEIDMLCPNGCLHKAAPQPLKISGSGIKHCSHDTYYADAVALCCMKKIGTIEVRVSTIFGIEEDEIINSGRYGRVY